MVRITEDLIRKRSEHNELIISTLEEISLHQQDIEKIEHIHDWCKELQILLMQNNLISKIENLYKLKKLEYLNLAINNIEIVEGLEKLESLKKLDLTLNFIGRLTTIANLRENENLAELHLTGNPCSDYSGYRDYVLATLPQLTHFDGIEIKRSDKIVALKNLPVVRGKIVQLEAEYSIKRDEQKIRLQEKLERENDENAGLDEEEINKRFWDTKTEHSPEIRVEIARQQNKNRPKNIPKIKAERQTILFAKDGRPYCINQPKLKFTMIDERDRYELTLHVYKHLDTSLIDVDVQPTYLRVTLKKKIFQMALNNEIKLSESSTKRATITGHLVIIMPKLHYKESGEYIKFTGSKKIDKNETEETASSKKANLRGIVDIRNICNEKQLPQRESTSIITNDNIDDLPPLVNI